MREETAPIALPRIPEGYRQWNRILIDALFPPGRIGTHVYLSVHAGFLDEVGLRHGRGGHDDFISSVLQLAAPRRFFSELSMYWEIWDDNRRAEPPFVAGLALAVLAVGEMETDENATSANYYVRLNALLGTPGRERPDSFETTVALWRSLQDWLHRTRRGELVLRGLDGARPYVDAVKSQCLVRSCDLDTLTNALRTFSGVLVSAVEPEEVAQALGRWLAASGSRSRLARLLGPRPSSAVLLQAAEALCDALDRWTGVDTPTHVPAVATRPDVVEPASLAIRPNRYPNLMWRRAEWLLRIAASVDAEDAEVLVQVGDRVLIAHLDIREPASYDVVVSSDDAARIVRGQLRVVDDAGVELTPQPEQVLWFEDGALRGRQGSWVLTKSPRIATPHVVVTSSAEQLAAVQRHCASPGISLSSAEAWPGATLFAAHSVALSVGDQPPGNVTTSETTPTLRLAGGLLLRRRVYLRGALPRVAGPDDADCRLRTGDGAEVVTSAVSLATLELPEGAYSVESSEGSTGFFVVEPRWRECVSPGSSALDPEVQRSFEGCTPRGAIAMVTQERHVTHVRPGVTFRLYTTAMLKGEASPLEGVHEIVTRSRPHDFVTIRSTRPNRPQQPADCFDEISAASEARWTSTDRLLEFISARGEGSVGLARTYCANIVPERWHSVLTTLEDLGHIDVCWIDRRWFAAPGAAVPRAMNPSQSIFVGARARESLQWLLDRGIRAQLLPAEASCAPSPGLLIAPTDDVIRAEADLSRINVRVFQDSPALTLAAHARPVVERSWWVGQEFTPSSRIRRTLERWDAQRLGWIPYPEDSAIDGPALYRWREQGVRMHYYSSRFISCSVRDFAAVKWSLAPRDCAYLDYDPKSGQLKVPVALGLTRALRRACSVAHGLPPTRRGRVLVYEGVPLPLARMIAVRLNQSKAQGLW